jgi:hypothetical protein
MMKKLQVMIEDELMETLKIFAVRQGKSLKDIVTESVETHIGLPALVPEPEPVVSTKNEVIPAIEPEEDDQSMGGMFHIIPKTHKIGKPHKQMKQYHEGPVSWMILEGCRSHFDKNDKMIPFRFTGDDGKVWEPDLDEINELSQYYGKPVEMEQ